MTSLCTYEVAYPDIVHPLIKEKRQLKENYIRLLYHYAGMFLKESDTGKSLYRLDALSKILLNKPAEKQPPFDKKSYRKAFSSVNRTRFTPFRLYSYRYVFLFDALFVLGIEDNDPENRLCEEILRMTGQFFHTSFHEMIGKMYNNDTAFAEKRLITPEMAKAWVDARKYLSSCRRTITFTATMSAGKSTLINALMGRELSFSKKAACTSTVIRFLTSPCKTQVFSVADDSGKISFLSEREVREFTNALTKPCQIMAYFDSVLTTRRITIVDTPGINSSQNPMHKKITRDELMNETDILVYVIPVESYGSEDDYNHLSYIRKNIYYNKILFVVNMMDSCDFEDDTTEEIIYNIKEHLSEIGFEDPIVCPMSAKAGFLLKKAAAGAELSDNARKACRTFAALFADERLRLEKYYPNVTTPNDYNVDSTIWQAFVSTGLPGFESMLEQYIREEPSICWM